MPALYLLNLENSTFNCKIGNMDNSGATIGTLTNNTTSGENFCGKAGNVSGHGKYVNSVSSKADSTSSAHGGDQP